MVSERTWLIKDKNYYKNKCERLENQQKEFIEYLKQMLDSDDDNFSVVRVRDILSKYNEITGVK